MYPDSIEGVPPGGPPIPASIIISTRNRAPQLSRTLKSYEALRASEGWELVVVDNGSTDSTPDVLERAEASQELPITRLREPKPGKSRALNRAVATATGAILILTDDDCYPEPDLVERYRELFSDPDLGFAGGRIELFDAEDAPVTLASSPEPRRSEGGSPIWTGIFHGANLAVRHSAFVEVGGFDNDFGPGAPMGSGDDVDLVARLLEAGWDGVYHPDPTVYHHHGRQSESDLQSLYKRYNRGRGAYLAKRTLTGTLRLQYLKRWWWHLAGRGRPGVYAQEFIGSANWVIHRTRCRLQGRTHEPGPNATHPLHRTTTSGPETR